MIQDGKMMKWGKENDNIDLHRRIQVMFMELGVGSFDMGQQATTWNILETKRQTDRQIKRINL